MSPAEQIKARRKVLGIDPGDLAQMLGITAASYDDLEAYDDELETVLSITQAFSLAKALAVPIQELLFGRIVDGPVVEWGELPERIKAHLKERSISLEEFEEQVGWDLGELLSASSAAPNQYPLMVLQDLSGVLGVPYHALVPSHMA